MIGRISLGKELEKENVCRSEKESERERKERESISMRVAKFAGFVIVR